MEDMSQKGMTLGGGDSTDRKEDSSRVSAEASGSAVSNRSKGGIGLGALLSGNRSGRQSAN